ncbi:MAG TPA: sugar ABC transporter substrate-binding protein [Phycisphaerae bacterium]|nr:sugar ABC transporter substrate-binding protein [Phycisphaerae bacterium]
MMRRVLFALVAAGVVGLIVWAVVRPMGRAGADGALLGARPLASPEALRGEVEVWSWNIAAGALQECIPGFNRRYPHVKVHVNMTGARMQTRFFLSLCAGVGGPDVSQLQNVEGPQYTQARRLTDLTRVAARYEKQFAPAFWTNCIHDGKVYAIPWDMGPCAVFYKRDIFRRSGVDPSAIETWDEFLEAGRTIFRETGGRTKLFHLPTSNRMTAMFEILIQQNGGQVFDDRGRLAVNSPETLQVLGQLRRFLDSGVCSNVDMWTAEYMASIKNDTVATYPIAVWFGGTIKDQAPRSAGNWGVFRLPALEPGGRRVSNFGGSVLVIPDQCSNKEAAWAFVEYALCTKEGQLTQYKHFDLFPSLMTTFDDPFFDEGEAFYGGQKVRRLFATEIEKIPRLNRTARWNEAMRYIGQALSRWATAATPPNAFLDALEAKMLTRLGVERSPESLGVRREAAE